MWEYKTRIALGAILAVVIATGFAFELNYLLPNNTTSSSSSNSPTASFGKEMPPTNCTGSMGGPDVSFHDGYELDVYASNHVPLGGNVCVYTHLENLDNQSTSPPMNESLVITSGSAFGNVPFAPGTVYFQGECYGPPSGSFGPIGNNSNNSNNSYGWNCSATWDSANEYTGTPPAFEYILNVAVSISKSSTVITGGAGIIVPEEQTTTNTAATTNGAANGCGSSAFELLTPVQNGSVYLRVVTTQGTVINNGSVLVTHTVPSTTGTPAGTSAYCLRLQANATGYLPLSVNDSLSTAGSYNLTLLAGYNQGPGYQGIIPAFTVQPDTTVYVTVSVPSGEIYIVTSTQGSSLVATTTTTATSLANGG